MIRKLIVAILLIACTVLVSTTRLAVLAGQRRSSAPIREPLSGVGESRTPLGDGTWLIAGGQGPEGPVRTLSIFNPATNTTVVLPAQLHEPRAGHTATVLPDGRILIVGGRGASGGAVVVAERFDPATETLSTLEISGATPRAGHSATLLTDRRLLIAGGESEAGRSASSGELWDLETRTMVAVNGAGWRIGHTATLLADGRVLFSGGTDDRGRPVSVVEIFNPRSNTVSPQNASQPVDDGPPIVTEARPSDRTIDVPLDATLTLRLSHGVVPESVSDQTVVLEGRQGPLASRVVVAEDGRLLFVWPLNPFESGTTYRVSLNGVTDPAGRRAVLDRLSFTTTQTAATPQAVDEELWTPDPSAGDGWRTHRSPSPWQSLPAMRAEPGVTAIAGQVLTLDGRPLRDVTLEVDDDSTRTDATGRFLLRLSVAKTTHLELGIDGRTANRAHRVYGQFEYGLNVESGRTTVLPFTIWMPRLDVAHEMTIPSPTAAETIITTPFIPGLELHLPAQTVVRDEDGRAVTRIGITPIPVDRPPFPLAANVDVPVYFTIQPGGAYVETPTRGQHGAWLIYPNYRGARPSQLVQFFHYDPEEKGWYVYGVGAVTQNGTQVVPDPTTRLYEFTGAMINSGSSPAGKNAPAGWDACCEPVDPSTGLFIMNKTDLYLPDVIPLALTRSYNSGDDFARPLGRGMTHPYAMFLWSALQWQQADLILPDGGKIHYVRTSSGSSFDDAVFTHQESATTSATPTVFYKSVITWNGRGWNLTLTDGTVYVFGENAPLQAVRDRYGNSVTVEHANGQSGNVTRVTSPSGRWLAFTYDAGNRISQVTDNIGRTVNYTYDANGNMATVTDAEGGVTTYTWSGSNQLASIKDPRNIVYLTNTYQNGRIQSQALADPAMTYQLAYTLDAGGNITQTDVTDPRGHVERRSYNADHYTTSQTQALGLPEERTITFERQTGSNIVQATIDGLGRRTVHAYDGSGHLLSTTRLAGTPAAVTTSYTYGPRFFQLATVTDPLGHTWTASYDMSGRPIGISDPLGNRTSIAISSAGQVTRVTDPLQHSWQLAYSGGDLASVTDPMNAVYRLISDSAGRVIGATDPTGQTTRFVWNRLNLKTGVVDALGGSTAMTYDGNGNLLTLTDALGRTTRYGYDVFDRVATRTDPLLRTESREYDGNDNLTRVVDRKGQTTTYQYDALDRVSLITFGDGSTIAYTYDAGDRVTQIVDSVNGSISRQYDLLDRVTQESTPAAMVTYAYDADNRRTTMTVSGQSAISYEYDAAHQLTSVTQDGAAVGVSYDEAGRRNSLSLPNGIVTAHSYDAVGRLTRSAYVQVSQQLGDLTYAYDAVGNRTAMGGSWARSGLPQALSAAAYDEANRLTGWNGRSFTYDANGNLVSDGVNSYTWIARNLLGSIGGGTQAMFQYDAVGRRRTKTVGGITTGFVYDGLNIVQERNGAGAVTANLLASLGLDEAFVRTDTGTNMFLTDALGSTVGLVDASGSMRAQYTYEPFGATTTFGTSPNKTQFTGRENDGTGLYFHRARYYSPETGRFISEDPLDFAAGDTNLYAYVGNRPTQSTDPLGLYDKGVHYDLTKGIGNQIGMCAGDAARVAVADQLVDVNPWTSPMPVGNVVARALYHFTTPEQLDSLRRRAFDSGSLSAMGKYLHALQDSYSHQKGRKDRDGEFFGPVVGHFFQWTGPDNPSNRPIVWKRMSEATSREMYQFHQTYPGCQTK